MRIPFSSKFKVQSSNRNLFGVQFDVPCLMVSVDDRTIRLYYCYATVWMTRIPPLIKRLRFMRGGIHQRAEWYNRVIRVIRA